MNVELLAYLLQQICRLDLLVWQMWSHTGGEMESMGDLRDQMQCEGRPDSVPTRDECRRMAERLLKETSAPFIIPDETRPDYLRLDRHPPVRR